jgi:hypothetical protein
MSELRVLRFQTARGLRVLSEAEAVELVDRLRKTDNAQGGSPGDAVAVATMIEAAMAGDEWSTVELQPNETRALSAELHGWLIDSRGAPGLDRIESLHSALQSEL